MVLKPEANMNFINFQNELLPLALPVAHADSRRRQVAGLKLADAAMLEFNYHLQGVSRRAPPVDADQITSLARWLQDLPSEAAEATINVRLARAESLRRMLDDPDWSLPANVAQSGRRLLDYIRRIDDLIPDDMPLLGHLDDALLVELSWSEFAGEIQDYLDYCRFRGGSHLRGSADERRKQWETAVLAEAGELIHRQQVRERGYARIEPLNRPFRVC
jgi:hypothetical protein